MIDKYSIYEIFEIENGWLVKETHPESNEYIMNPGEAPQSIYETRYFATIEKACEYIIERCNNA